MYMKSLVSLAVLGAMSAVATAGDHVVFDKPNESYTVDGLNKYGATIKASDITITNTTYNGIDAYGVFDLNAANDISIQGATNGIFTPSDHQNSSIKITTPKKLTITGRGPFMQKARARSPLTRATSSSEAATALPPTPPAPSASTLKRSTSPALTNTVSPPPIRAG